MLGIDPRLISVAVLCAVFFIPLDGFVAVMAKYDAYIFWAIVVGFAILSVIGTVAVVRSGDLPANDELFNLREAQRQGVAQRLLQVFAPCLLGDAYGGQIVVFCLQ